MLELRRGVYMFQQHIFKRRFVATTGVLLLLVLPLSGECQSDRVQTEEPSEPIEEIVVRGNKSLIKLKHEMYEAEEALYDLYNLLNINDDFDIRCYKEAPTGSHIKQRICRPQKLGELLSEQTQRMLRGEPYVYPAAEIEKMNEHMLAEMTEMVSEHPEYLDALIKYTETKQTMESERKRRCEGRFLICRRQ
jgi:hypothetical protein